MTTERDPAIPKFTGQEDIYSVRTDKFFDPSDVLKVLFNQFNSMILDDPGKIARVLVKHRDLSCLVPLFTIPNEDNLTAEARLTTAVTDFVSSEKNAGNLSDFDGYLKVKKESEKPDSPPTSPGWKKTIKSILREDCKDALRFQVGQIEQDLLAS